MVSLKRLGLLLWYGLGLFLVLAYVQRALLAPARAVAANGSAGNVLWLAEALVGLAVLAGLFVLVHLAARSWPSLAGGWAARTARPPAPTTLAGDCFPSAATLLIGLWLLVIAVLNVLALFAVIEPPRWLSQSFPSVAPGPDDPGMVQDMLVTMFAAGIGSSISVILGYLEHASIRKDFDLAYSPWYVARPIMGMLTGVIFYFVLKGGLLATAPTMTGGANLDDLSLAGFGALVGLFSKNALEKLRELFNTLFATQRDFAAEVKGRVPSDVWAKIAPYFPTAEGEPDKPREGDAKGGKGGAGGGQAPPAEGPPEAGEPSGPAPPVTG